MNKDETINYGAQIIAQSLNKPDVIKFNDIGLRKMSQIIEDMNKGVMESLYSEGYRKIEDDEIIIKRRQYEQLKKHNRDRKRLRLRWQQAKQELEQAKQESVRDFAKIVISAIWEEEENEKIKIKDVHDTIRDILRMNFGIELED